jgi:hypothetical protein
VIGFLFFVTLYNFRQGCIEKVPLLKNKDENKDEIKLEGSDWFVCLLKARIKNNKMLEGSGRPLNPPRKMLIVTTPGGKKPPPPWKGGNAGLEAG